MWCSLNAKSSGAAAQDCSVNADAESRGEGLSQFAHARQASLVELAAHDSAVRFVEVVASGAGPSTVRAALGAFDAAERAVQDVRYSVHEKRDAPPDAPRTMRVEYRIGWQRSISEWICIEHTGYARAKAESWWRRRSNVPMPDTAEEAVRLAEAGALCGTQSITVRSVAGEKYDRITGYVLGEKPAYREPGWDEDEPVPVTANGEEVDDDNLPF